MISAGWLLMAAAQAGPGLTMENGRLVVSSAGQRIEVPVRRFEPPSIYPADRLTLTFAGRKVTFERGGMIIDQNGRPARSSLPDLAMTTKLHGNAAIAETRRKIASGERQAGFTALSGYEYLGTTLYLLLRWEERSGEPWLEAVVALPMDSERVQPRLLGRFPGFSYAQGNVDDRLDFHSGFLALIGRRDGQWGLARMNPSTTETSYSPFGPAVDGVRISEGGGHAYGFRSANGLTSVIEADLIRLQSRLVAEVEGTVRRIVWPFFLETREGTAPVLRNLRTGAVLRPRWGSQYEWTSAGLLVWSPELEPDRAQLLDGSDFRTLASWTKTP
ncbi:MAG: hypothetical protein MH204_06420 [Fimbriimonadaceae bacterium]|nr:hypothetical protein [Fimbriimonadaceae bacterium]